MNIKSHVFRKNHRFIFKLTSALLLIIVLSISIFGFTIIKYSVSVLQTKVIQEEEQSLNQITSHLSYIQDTVKMTAQSIAITNDVQKNLRGSQTMTVFQGLVRHQMMRTLLNSFNMMQPYFEDILIVSNQGDVYSSNNTENAQDILYADWLKKWQSDNYTSGYSGIHNYYKEQGQESVQVITYILPFRDLENMDSFLGNILININIDKMLDNNETRSEKNYTLYNSDNEIIFGKKNSADITDIRIHPQLFSSDNGNILLSDDDLQNNWVLATEISTKDLHKIIFPVTSLLLLLIVLLAIVIVVTMISIFYHFTRPITILKNASDEISKGNLDFHLDIVSNDEFTVLGNTFNNMILSIKDLIQSSVDYEKENKENEIARLMLQINPHFIYNTLNSIVYMAKMHRDEEIIHYTNAFISLLQDTLYVDTNNIFIPLGQEVKNINNYIELQKVRYPGKLHVKYELQEDVLEYAVPNVFIQPIVENAIYHGIAGKPDGGTLLISAFEKENILHICVKDDGVGMDENKVNELLKKDERINGSMRSIGIANVRNRIKHIYGDAYDLKIISSPSNGTSVIICIPGEKYVDVCSKNSVIHSD